VTVPNRIKKEDEEVGFDLAIHGEVAYPAEVTHCFHWYLVLQQKCTLFLHWTVVYTEPGKITKTVVRHL
jgi:hypothetical protein